MFPTARRNSKYPSPGSRDSPTRTPPPRLRPRRHPLLLRHLPPWPPPHPTSSSAHPSAPVPTLPRLTHLVVRHGSALSPGTALWAAKSETAAQDATQACLTRTVAAARQGPRGPPPPADQRALPFGRQRKVRLRFEAFLRPSVRSSSVPLLSPLRAFSPLMTLLFDSPLLRTSYALRKAFPRRSGRIPSRPLSGFVLGRCSTSFSAVPRGSCDLATSRQDVQEQAEDYDQALPAPGADGSELRPEHLEAAQGRYP